ncbi:hypothetical protein V7x_42900 [Crateriforma conspicua]|uniref:DUF4185 domain-containing protein n=1 Tax=Crateriforma conspicua TaxID=2527996 RepID=A0A5C6FJV2_9PLAN|nr:DUF4185 domain-containing protein [Crateriforma conspicua]TWU62555.1 hypothetical protein V7x_42900 [Crateriforma conspicua]
MRLRVSLFLTLLISPFVRTSYAQPSKAPYPPSGAITDVSFDWSTHTSKAPGSDNWPTTWSDDGHLYAAWGDGGGFGGTNKRGRSSLGIARIEGDAETYRGFNVWGGHEPETQQKSKVIGKSYGLICVEGVLYMWVGLFRPNSTPFDEVRLAHSLDKGHTWKFCDWSFTRADRVMIPTFLNFGRDNAGARDQYVYSYLIRYQSEEGPDNYEDKVPWLQCQRPGLIDLARVPKTGVLDRSKWEFFCGSNTDGSPKWTSQLQERKPVFEDSNGVGWCISVSHNGRLRRYILASEHTETHRGNLGIHDAPEPWGPWSTCYYAKGWGDNQIPKNTFYWSFVNKWLSTDGTDFVMVFTGRKENDSWNTVHGKFHRPESR